MSITFYININISVTNYTNINISVTFYTNIVSVYCPWEIILELGNLLVVGDVKLDITQLEAVYGHSLVVNPSLGMYQAIHPYSAMNFDSLKINTSLAKMKECKHKLLRGGMYWVLHLRRMFLQCTDTSYWFSSSYLVHTSLPTVLERWRTWYLATLSASVQAVSRTTSTKTKMITILKAIRLIGKATNGVGVERPLFFLWKARVKDHLDLVFHTFGQL